MRIQIGLLLAALLVAPASVYAATCPVDVPVVTIAPHQQGGFSWGNGIRPMGDPCVGRIGVDPLNDSAWYVGGSSGLYMTKTAGLFWTKPLIGNVGVIYMEPNHQLVYVGVGNKLYLSRDQGQNWNAIGTYSTTVRSVLVVGNTLYVGLHWSTHAVPSGIYRSNLGGGFSTFLPFGAGHTGLIVWSLAYDPIDAMLYAGNEIYDHLPAPYVPKFFRSANGGTNWSSNLQGTMTNHVIAMAVRPADGYLYALNEGGGVYGSSTNGSTWIPPVSPMGVGDSLLMDPLQTTRLFAGRQKSGLIIGDGGAWVSTDAGKTFTAIGLPGATVGQMSFNGTRTKLYAAAYASGVYVSPMP
ncbi:MAG: WD40/YVTN/BNR-like repeat-containing protein [Thermoanaerobaculia bacterium]